MEVGKKGEDTEKRDEIWFLLSHQCIARSPSFCLSCDIWFPHSSLESFPGNFFEFSRDCESSPLSQHVQHESKQSRLFTCFPLPNRFEFPSFPLKHFPVRFSSLSSLSQCDENVMNENVFYVMLHNIIVFNRQIPLSRHLIFGRWGRGKLYVRGIFFPEKTLFCWTQGIKTFLSSKCSVCEKSEFCCFIQRSIAIFELSLVNISLHVLLSKD